MRWDDESADTARMFVALIGVALILAGIAIWFLRS